MKALTTVQYSFFDHYRYIDQDIIDIHYRSTEEAILDPRSTLQNNEEIYDQSPPQSTLQNYDRDRQPRQYKSTHLMINLCH